MGGTAFIAGGTGFVGVKIANELARSGFSVTVMGRSMTRPRNLDAAVSCVAGDGTLPGDWQETVAGSSLVINLAGASIFSRWTRAHKKLLRDSRILTTRHIVEALPADASGVRLFSTSAVGYYGFHGDENLSEASPPGNDYLADLCRDWEAEAEKAAPKGCPVVITRFGIVLGKDGGAVGRMLTPFRLGLGGPVGNGRQWFSWIHMTDLLGALFFLLGRTDASGPYNLTAPAPVRNRDLARTLGSIMHRPSLMPAPAFAVKSVLGEFGDVILKGQRVLPARLLEIGYEFRFKDIGSALRDVLS